jgi:hypothetical protein
MLVGMPAALRILALASGLVVLSGCSTPPGSGGYDQSPVSIEIGYSTDYSVTKAVRTVFVRNGYQVLSEEGGRFDFRHPVTGRRVDAQVLKLEFATYEVSCGAFRPAPDGNGAWVPDPGARSELKGLLRDIKEIDRLM